MIPSLFVNINITFYLNGFRGLCFILVTVVGVLEYGITEHKKMYFLYKNRKKKGYLQV